MAYDWSYDEVVLAMDLFLRSAPEVPHRASDEASELSNLLRRLGAQMGRVIDEKYRNTNGVESKLWNIMWLASDGLTGRPNCGRLTREVWRELGALPNEVTARAAAIRALIESGDTWSDPSDTEREFGEGGIVEQSHKRRERKDVRSAKLRQERQAGRRICCAACDLDFENEYGDLGIAAAEVHHTIPVSTMNPGHKTKLSDLVILCANCRRLVHGRRPWLKIEDVQALVKRSDNLSR